MKKIIFVFAAGVLLIFSVAGTYYLYVGAGRPISHDGIDWAVFGNYFGGVLGSLLSFISILLLVYTVELQRKQLDNAQYEMRKRDMLSHVAKADDEIERWLGRKLTDYSDFSNGAEEFGDVVWGLISHNRFNTNEFCVAVVRLHLLTCRYCQALGLYRENVDPFHIFSYHKQKAESLLQFLKKHESLLGQMAGPSLEFCQMHLDGRHGDEKNR